MNISPSYEYLIKEFGEDVIKRRYEHMSKRAVEFIKAKGLEEKVALNFGMLNIVVLDYFADIHRLKEFEGIAHINKNKITAYISYWWLRRKPLQVIVESIDEENLVYINEEFVATIISKDFMHPNTEKLLTNDQCKQCIKHILYHLKYRVYTAQTLELMLMSADTGIKIGNIQSSTK